MFHISFGKQNKTFIQDVDNIYFWEAIAQAFE